MKIFDLLIAIALCGLAASCAEEVENEIDKGQTGDFAFVIEDFVSDEATKTAFQVSTMSFQWSEDDVIGIFPSEGFQAEFPMESGAGSSVAVFDGGSWGLKPDATYYAYYPFSLDNFESKDKRESVEYSYEGQEACLADATGLVNLSEYDFMASGACVLDNGVVNFRFRHLGALCRIRFDAPAGAEYSKFAIEARNNVFPMTGYYDATDKDGDGKIEYVSDNDRKSSFYVAFPSGRGGFEESEKVEVYFLMPPVDLSSQSLVFKLWDTNGDFYVSSIGGKNIKAGMSYGWNVAFEESYTYTIHNTWSHNKYFQTEWWKTDEDLSFLNNFDFYEDVPASEDDRRVYLIYSGQLDLSDISRTFCVETQDTLDNVRDVFYRYSIPETFETGYEGYETNQQMFIEFADDKNTIVGVKGPGGYLVVAVGRTPVVRVDAYLADDENTADINEEKCIASAYIKIDIIEPIPYPITYKSDRIDYTYTKLADGDADLPANFNWTIAEGGTFGDAAAIVSWEEIQYFLIIYKDIMLQKEQFLNVYDVTAAKENAFAEYTAIWNGPADNGGVSIPVTDENKTIAKDIAISFLTDEADDQMASSFGYALNSNIEENSQGEVTFILNPRWEYKSFYPVITLIMPFSVSTVTT